MPFIHRAFAPAGVGGVLSNRSWLHARARLSAIDCDGFVWNPARGNLPTPTNDGRVYVHWVVSGRAHVLDKGVVLTAGDAWVADSYRNVFEAGGSMLAFSGAHRAIAFRIDGALVGSEARGSIRLGTGEDLHDKLSRATTEQQGADLGSEMAARLTSTGFPVASIPLATTRDADLAVAHSLSTALSLAAPRPMLVDVMPVGFQRTERQTRRRIDAFLRHYGMPFYTWREIRQSYCLTAAALFMSRPGARTKDVAKAAGFASATSLCHALQRSSLRSPQQIAASAAALARAL